MCPFDHDFLGAVTKMKLPALESLGDDEKAGPVPQQTFETVPPAIEKQEKVTAHRVFFELA